MVGAFGELSDVDFVDFSISPLRCTETLNMVY